MLLRLFLLFGGKHMYKIKRSRHIVENLQIEDGGKVLDLVVDVIIDDIMKKYIDLGSRLAKLQGMIEAGEKSEDLYAEYGKTVVAYFELFFGTEQTARILNFYNNRYSEMLLDVTPFLQDVVVPAIIKAQEDTKNKYKAMAKRRYR